MATDQRPTALKIGYKGEIHRLRVDLAAFQLADLEALFATTFNLSAGSFVVQYTDPEGDCVNVTSEAEYAEACRVFLSTADAVKSLRFSAVSRTQVVFQENVAEPILKALEKLVESLNAAMEKVKHEQWAQRAQATASATAQKAHASAQVGLDQTNEALRAAAKEARESLNAARQSLQEIPFDQIVKDTTEGLKYAAEGISDFAKEVVGEIKSYNASPAVVPVSQQEEAAGEISESVDITPTPTAVATTGSDNEWEDVTEPAVAVPVAEEAPVVVETPAVSAEELKWASELATIRDFLPTADTANVIDRLEQCNGNVEVVINALMEA